MDTSVFTVQSASYRTVTIDPGDADQAAFVDFDYGDTGMADKESRYYVRCAGGVCLTGDNDLDDDGDGYTENQGDCDDSD